MSIARGAHNGLVTGTALGSVTTAQTYNGFGELATYSAAFGGNPIFEAIYDTAENPRDKLGRIADLTEIAAGVTTTYHYEYDETGRLADVWKNGGYISHYGYDANGNRITRTHPISGTGITPDDVVYDDQDRLLQYGVEVIRAILSLGGPFPKGIIIIPSDLVPRPCDDPDDIEIPPWPDLPGPIA